MKLCSVGAMCACVFVLAMAACGTGGGGSEQEQIAASPLAKLPLAADRGRQRQTMADMRSFATANGTMRVDIGRYARTLAELGEKGYLRSAPPTDAWGNAWLYSTGADTYTIVSLGSDGAAGPAPPREWLHEPYEPDLVLTDGAFTQAPAGR